MIKTDQNSERRMMTYRVEQTTNPDAFLALAGEHLAADPVLSTVVSTTLERAVADPRVPEHPRWWAAVLDGEQVVGVGMRTAPFRQGGSRFCAPWQPVVLEDSGPEIDTPEDLALCRSLEAINAPKAE